MSSAASSSYDDDFDDVQCVVNAACEGRIDDLNRAFDACGPASRQSILKLHDLTYNDLHGNFITLLALSSQKQVLLYLKDAVPIDAQTLTESLAAFFCVQFRRYEMALFLFGMGANVNHAMPESLDTILHFACKSTRPSVSFVQQLTRLRALSVNKVNSDGHTSLHVVCVHSTGVEGREVVRLLLRRGVNVDALVNGRTAGQMTTNPYIRETLSLYGFRSRAVPQLNSEVEARYDSIADISNVPEVSPDPALLAPRSMTASPALLSKKSNNNNMSTTSTTITPAKQRALVQRLYTNAMELRTQKHEAKLQKTLEPMTFSYVTDPVEKAFLEKQQQREMTRDDIEECVSRLCDRSADDKEAAMAAAYAKHVVDPPEPKFLGPEEISSMAIRLHSTSMDEVRRNNDKLNEKYVKNTVTKHKKKLGKAQLEASVSRLYTESMSKTASTKEKLMETYIKKEQNRFCSGHKFTMDDWVAMGDRLYSKRKM
eukprot:PhM_4_TR2532/c0_g1_i1/m.91165